ncbi:hypothetical protein [Nostoc parmelioides]|uniref:Uncharacterized protein n=1 Tax=Nostoc parmelioides FACHB-3921 TaxID=2692909 RepID=A0ABR8BR45_9NOSO|nr:hypothetical protein [Nostoc parmelioides]MBD2255398.1 hypothetical protein [Nostoc parmelioides FACHB-3921]
MTQKATAKLFSLMMGLSKEYENFLASGYKCSQCSEVLYSMWKGYKVNFYSKNGEKIKPPFIYKAEIVECPNCNYRWNVRGESNVNSANKVLEIKETQRSEEFIGKEQRLIDNSKSTSKITRRFTITREWSKAYSIEYEKTQVNGLDINLKLKFLEVELDAMKLLFQETIKKQYSISEETKENYTEEVIVEVPEYKKTNLIFSWKRIWQDGFIKICSPDNTEISIPFKVVVGVTFDQSVVEEI